MRITFSGVADFEDATDRHVEAPRDAVAQQFGSRHRSCQLVSVACGVKRPSRIDGCDISDRDVCFDFVSLGILRVNDLHVVLRDVDVSLLVRGALSPASQRTLVLDNAVCVVNSFAPCLVSQDSLDSGGSVLPEEVVGARMCPLVRDSIVVRRTATR